MNTDGPEDKVTRLLYEPSDVSFAYRLVTTPAASQLRFAFACFLSRLALFTIFLPFS